MKYSIIFFFILFSSLSYSQKKDDCDIIGTKLDTVLCKDSTIISEVTFCENTDQNLFGLTYYKGGKEYLCFQYKYDSRDNLKKITFWTFHYIEGGYATDDMVAIIKYNEKGMSKLISKNKNCDIAFIERLGQANSQKQK